MINKEDMQQILQMMSLITQLGLIMISSIGIGFFIGNYFDGLLGLPFICTALFTLLGVAAGFLGIYKHIYSIINEE
ncbi:MAG: AtpZ/AtpI family protein [Bacillota bacterium]